MVQLPECQECLQFFLLINVKLKIQIILHRPIAQICKLISSLPVAGCVDWEGATSGWAILKINFKAQAP